MPDINTILTLTDKIYDKYGMHFSVYVLSIGIFCYFFFKYLASRDSKETELRDVTKKELELTNTKIVKLIEDHSKENDARRQAFTDMLTHQLNTAKDMMETISKQNLEAHKLLAERIVTIETKLLEIAKKVDIVAVDAGSILLGIKAKKE